MAALDISQAMHWASKIQPLNTHPNLAGIIFGLGLLLSAYGV